MWNSITKLSAIALLAIVSAGCQHSCLSRGGDMMPTPGGNPNDYYTPSLGTTTTTPSATIGRNPPVNLAPETSPLKTSSTIGAGSADGSMIPAGSTSVGAVVRNSREDTYNVSVRTPDDLQPIRVVSGGSPGTTPVSLAGAMPVNDGTAETPWARVSQPLPFNHDPAARSAAVAPFAGLRGTSLSTPGLGKTSLSNEDGQWKSRGSYEATERR